MRVPFGDQRAPPPSHQESLRSGDPVHDVGRAILVDKKIARVRRPIRECTSEPAHSTAVRRGDPRAVAAGRVLVLQDGEPFRVGRPLDPRKVGGRGARVNVSLHASVGPDDAEDLHTRTEPAWICFRDECQPLPVRRPGELRDHPDVELEDASAETLPPRLATSAAASAANAILM